MRSCASATRTFVGMQPLFKQVPPRLSFSMRTVFSPACAARMAAIYPPGPAPIIATSYCICYLSLCFGNRLHFYPDRSFGQQIWKFFRPFYNRNSIAVKVFFQTNVYGCTGARQPVPVKMIDRISSSFIYVKYRKGGRIDIIFFFDVKSVCQTLHKTRLSGTEFARQGNNISPF